MDEYGEEFSEHSCSEQRPPLLDGPLAPPRRRPILLIEKRSMKLTNGSERLGLLSLAIFELIRSTAMLLLREYITRPLSGPLLLVPWLRIMCTWSRLEEEPFSREVLSRSSGIVKLMFTWLALFADFAFADETRFRSLLSVLLFSALQLHFSHAS